MQAFPYNTKAINAAGNTNSIVYLPASSTGMAFLLYERTSPLMQGSVTKTITLLGDLSKVAVIGASSVDVSITLEGTLTQYKTTYFDPAGFDTSFTLAGSLTAKKHFPLSELSFAMDVAGTLVRRGSLSGSITKTWTIAGPLIRRIVFDPTTIVFDMTLAGVLGARQFLHGNTSMERVLSGTLSIFSRNYFDYAATGMTFNLNGTLLQTIRMQGDTGMSMDIEGFLQRTANMSGTSYIEFDMAGSLANNANVQDLTGFMMIRRKSVREMAR